MKIPEDIKKYITELSKEYPEYNLSVQDIDRYELCYNDNEEYFINKKINQCCKWVLRRDDGNDKYNKKINRDERCVLERIINKIK